MDGYWYYFGGSNDGSLKTDIGLYDYGVYVGIDGRWDETRYQYSTGEFLSELQIINNGKDYNNACLMFWHNYGMSSSDEDFFFHWEEGKSEYIVQGERSKKQFVIRFTPSQAGMRIQVICKDGSYYSWTSGTKSETWVDAGYQKITGAPSRIE